MLYKYLTRKIKMYLINTQIVKKENEVCSRQDNKNKKDDKS